MKYVSCDICGSTETTTLYESLPQSVGPVVRCLQCGLVYVNPRVKDRQKFEGEEISKTYMDQLKWRLEVFRDRLRIINTYVQTGRLLDIGCYTGDFMGLAQEAGWDCIGVEPSVSLSAYVTKRCGIKVYPTILKDAEFDDNSFDVVTLFHVLEHLDSPSRELEEIFRILKPGGILVVEVPNVNNWIRRFLKKTSWTFNTEHYYHFSHATLQKLFQKCGFLMLSNKSTNNCVQLGRFLYLLDVGLRHGVVYKSTNMLRMAGVDRVNFKICLGTSILGIAQPSAK